MVGYLYFGAVTFSQVFCTCLSKLCLKLHSLKKLFTDLFTDPFTVYPPMARFVVVVSEAALTCGFPLAVFSLAVGYCGAEGSL